MAFNSGFKGLITLLFK